jgi:hypothetical protein
MRNFAVGGNMTEKSKDAVTKQIIAGILRGGISAIPYAGGILNEMFFEIRSRIKQERLLSFLEEYSASLQELQAIFKLEERAKDESFGDFFEFVLTRVVRNRAASKTKVYREALVKATVTDNFDTESYELLLPTIGGLSDSELLILKHWYRIMQSKKTDSETFYDTNLRIPLRRDPTDASSREFDLDRKQSNLGFEGLIARGLVIDTSSHYLDSIPRTFLVLSRLGVECILILEA